VESLTIGGAPTQLLEEWAESVQFRAKASPVTGFQLLDSAVVAAQRLARSIGLGAGERGFGWRPKGRGGRGRGGGSGFLEEHCQRAGERLVQTIRSMEVKFAYDSLLEGDGFELSVPGRAIRPFGRGEDVFQ
jgi:hypothetical protein